MKAQGHEEPTGQREGHAQRTTFHLRLVIHTVGPIVDKREAHA